MKRIALGLLFLAGGIGQAAADVQAFEIDPVHTRIAFFVQHAGFSRAIGTFSGTHGTLRIDPDAPASAQVEATVPIASLDLGDAEWRDKVLDPTFFDVGKFAEARFVSTAVDVVGDGSLRVSGDLTLHGVTAPVVLQVRMNPIRRHPLTLRTTAGFSATTTLSRAAFGMRKWKKLVGDTVEVVIEVEATRTRDSHDEKE